MEITDDVSEMLMLFIHPSGEGEEDIIEAQSVCECVSKKAYKNWTSEQYKEFSELLKKFSQEVEVAMKNTAQLIKNGPPKPSEKLFRFLERLGEDVESCEIALGVSVEF